MVAGGSGRFGMRSLSQLNIHLGMGLALTWSTVIDLFILLVAFKACWPWLTIVLQRADGPAFHFVLLAILVSATAILLYALLLETVSLEISRTLLWWLLVQYSSALLALGVWDYASTHSPSSDTHQRFEIAGYSVGGLIGIGTGGVLAIVLLDWTVGGRVGLGLAIVGSVAQVARWYRFHSARAPKRRRAEAQQRRLERIWREFRDLVPLAIPFYILNVFIVTFFTYMEVVTTGGVAAILPNLYRFPSVLRLAALNSARIMGITLIVLAVQYLWSWTASSTHHGNSDRPSGTK